MHFPTRYSKYIKYGHQPPVEIFNVSLLFFCSFLSERGEQINNLITVLKVSWVKCANTDAKIWCENLYKTKTVRGVGCLFLSPPFPIESMQHYLNYLSPKTKFACRSNNLHYHNTNVFESRKRPDIFWWWIYKVGIAHNSFHYFIYNRPVLTINTSKRD